MPKRQRRDEQSRPFFLRDLRLKNDSQEHYVSLLKESTITLAIGPAGTGKTFIAAYVALSMLLGGEVDRIILCRPIVATEDIGYLPGTADEKIHPYIMPLVDAIEVHIGPTKTRDFFENLQLEALPLAYMRGRSLNRSVIILDEAQNTTASQMKMFLTRLGYGSKMFVSGDITQSDLPGTERDRNGLKIAVEKLRGIDEQISVMEFYAKDIVRHPLIEKIAGRLDLNVRPNNSVIMKEPTSTRVFNFEHR